MEDHFEADPDKTPAPVKRINTLPSFDLTSALSDESTTTPPSGKNVQVVFFGKTCVESIGFECFLCGSGVLGATSNRIKTFHNPNQ